MSASYRQAQSQCRAVCGSEREKSGRAHISYAQNYCPLLWDTRSTLKKEMLEALRLADMNVSEEEMELLTGCKKAGGRYRCTDASRHDTGAGDAQRRILLLSGCQQRPDGYLWRRARACRRHHGRRGRRFLGALLWRLRGRDTALLRAVPEEERGNITAFSMRQAGSQPKWGASNNAESRCR